ncbi:hypothetical protein ANCCEY_04001 [Ancylostoma ceylanicum]|uniref:Thrombospondin type 1 domain protein n=1 Tax=Ancylostoma ceylanicum TaxID=53326 RepID=A0A0D6LXV8_9BILA|nr:hypothetical protein ANCCEY_04001 [Ancylostoma ceylanicum]
MNGFSVEDSLGLSEVIATLIVFNSGWLASDWSECVPICGGGRRTRSVYCVHHAVNQTLNVPEKYCENQTKPGRYAEQHILYLCRQLANFVNDIRVGDVSEETCANESCGHWVTGRWTKCSAPCGQGTRRRTVRTLSPVVESIPADRSPNTQVECVGGKDCPFTSRPISEAVCYSGVPCSDQVQNPQPWTQLDNRNFARKSYMCSPECQENVEGVNVTPLSFDSKDEVPEMWLRPTRASQVRKQSPEHSRTSSRDWVTPIALLLTHEGLT